RRDGFVSAFSSRHLSLGCDDHGRCSPLVAWHWVSAKVLPGFAYVSGGERSEVNMLWQRFHNCFGSKPKGEGLLRARVWGTGCVAALLLLVAAPHSIKAVQAADPPAGSLEIIDKTGLVQGACPLKHTEVRGAISGFLARVTVTQQFQNSAENAIEA